MAKHIDLKMLKKIILYTVIWGVLAHGYRYLNGIYSHDSVMVFQEEFEWQFSLGRFLQPLYLLLRGNIMSSYLISMISLLFLSFSNYIVIKMFRFNNKVAQILICGIMSTNYVLTLSYATYMPWADIFMIALFAAVLAVHLFDNYKYGYLFVPFCIIVTCGLYQAYFSMTIVLFMCLLIRDVFEHQETKVIINKGLKAIGLMLIGLIAYYAVYKLSLYVFGFSAADSYNSIEVSLTSDVSILNVIIQTYWYVVYSIIAPSTFNWVISSLATAGLVIITGISLLRYLNNSKLDKLTIILSAITLLSLPFAMNISQLLSLGGVSHGLMAYGFIFFYIVLFIILNYDLGVKT